MPFGDNEKADLIAEFGGKLNKIQVKTNIKAENGVMKFDLTSSTTHRKNGEKHKYTTDEIDYFYCYNIQRDKSFLIKSTDEPISGITIRYEKPQNSNIHNVKMEKDYLFDVVLNKIIQKT